MLWYIYFFSHKLIFFAFRTLYVELIRNIGGRSFPMTTKKSLLK